MRFVKASWPTLGLGFREKDGLVCLRFWGLGKGWNGHGFKV